MHHFIDNNEFNLRWLMIISMHAHIFGFNRANDQESEKYQEKVNLVVIVRIRGFLIQFSFLRVQFYFILYTCRYFIALRNIDAYLEKLSLLWLFLHFSHVACECVFNHHVKALAISLFALFIIQILRQRIFFCTQNFILCCLKILQNKIFTRKLN